MRLTRRQLLANGAAVSVAFLALRRLDDWLGPSDQAPEALGLVRDPSGILELPAGFSYLVLSRGGERMSDGLLVPGAPDGMGAFPTAGGRVLIVRNHEGDLDGRSAFPPYGPFLGSIEPRLVYDRGDGSVVAAGGTTTLIYDPSARRLERQFLSLAGTLRNCSGGATPWGSWISCEECVTTPTEAPCLRAHGYPFEVPARADSGLVEPVPLMAMGRFRREAVAVDPASGYVYQTEDREDGLLYRFVPAEQGRLERGGQLQALRLRDAPGADTRNWLDAKRIPAGEHLAIEWVDLAEVHSPNDDLRARGHQERGAAIFARGEGMLAAADGIYFSATTGGPAQVGQIWHLRPGSGPGGSDTLELAIQCPDSRLLEGPDNLCVAPWGDLFVCEDGWGGRNHVRRVTRDGRILTFARAAVDSEFAGGVFSPDGSTLFVNLQRKELTLAITGPWAKLAA